MSTNFIELIKTEYDSVWDKFYQEFNFKPSVHSQDWPSIDSKLPAIKFDISKYFEMKLDDIDVKVNQIAPDLFINITKEGELMYALDWQHASYKFNPRLIMDFDEEFDEWLVPSLPNGDYYIFTTIDFRNVWFGHPWEQSISLFGEKYIGMKNEILKSMESIGFKLIA